MNGLRAKDRAFIFQKSDVAEERWQNYIELQTGSIRCYLYQKGVQVNVSSVKGFRYADCRSKGFNYTVSVHVA